MQKIKSFERPLLESRMKNLPSLNWFNPPPKVPIHRFPFVSSNIELIELFDNPFLCVKVLNFPFINWFNPLSVPIHKLPFLSLKIDLI